MVFPVKPILEIDSQLKDYPQSQFGYGRKFDIHTGIDVYTKPKEDVKAILGGTVIQMGIFTGELVGSPWWNTTSYVVIKSKGIYVLYGEIETLPLRVGLDISAGDILGNVKQVLKVDKGVNPVDMLHLECYTEYESPVVWTDRSYRPKGLINPEFLLRGNQ